MSLAGQIAWDDTILPFQLDRADVRGRVARLDAVLETILGQHAYPAPVAALMAEAVLLTALIGQTIRLRWRLSLQIRGQGAVRLIATDYFGPTADGRAGADARLCGLRRRGRRRAAAAAVRTARPRDVRDPDRPGAGDRAVPGHHPARRRLARRLRRDLFRPVRAAADALRAGDGRGGRAGRAVALALGRRDAAAHAEGLGEGAAEASARRPDSTACSRRATCSTARTRRTGTARRCCSTTVEATELIGPHVGPTSCCCGCSTRRGRGSLRLSRCASAAPAARRRSCSRSRSIRRARSPR